MVWKWDAVMSDASTGWAGRVGYSLAALMPER
jgi:hypothetical protein